MKLIIAGSRHLNASKEFIDEYLQQFNLYNTTEIISGNAQGIDFCGEEFAMWAVIPIKTFPANWDLHGKAAGPIRNKEMAEYADALLLIWDGESKGSSNMKSNMLKLNKPVYEVILRKHNA